ncbi:response regulator [Fulvivirgaceae bacterium PWU20]|uniref:Response regulator n=2 Tax=Chryseosolibacter indicus TaxID=2782351 RepID=A0ABS5VT26_9BACT|nr:response regulator [Chryseosolibacter indicus]MBT1704511.1 response regulator [Chryseosolibacter indicus]
MNIVGPIILVDDDHDDHEIIKSICENLGVCQYLKFFDNGFDLVSYLKTSGETPFLILCDINMPHINGMALRKLISEDAFLKRKSIPFIFFSTAATPDQVKEAYEDLTVQGFFIKGNTFQDTERRFKNILQYWSDCKHPNSIQN